MRNLRLVLSLGVLCLLTVLMSPAANAGAGKKTAPTKLTLAWELAKQSEGEPYWAPLFRLREAEAQCRDAPQWSAYAQMRAYLECNVGDHAAALAAWDSAFAPRDSMGTLPAGIRARDAVDYLSAVADTARVMMINERHHAATGIYLRDPVFAELVREALRLGYTLVPYESMRGEEAGDDSMTTQQRRDFTQARNLARATVEQDLKAKVLVHAGYSHVLERASKRFTPMALYFRQLTGIDPVTVDQTRLSERSGPRYEDPAYRACVKAGFLKDGPVILFDASGKPYAPAALAVDYQVFTPRTRYVDRRPAWLACEGLRRAVSGDVPEAQEQWCMVAARVPDEPPEAIPLDRCEVEGTEKATLFVPVGQKFVLRVLDQDGEELRETLETNARSEQTPEGDD